MKFCIHALNGGGPRMGTYVAFVDDLGQAATAVCPRAGGFSAWERETGRHDEPLTSVDDAAERIATLLHRYRDHCLVIYSGGGYTVRGDEHTTADVYPPGRHPRINVSG